MINLIRLETRGYDIIVSVQRDDGWHDVIRAHGALPDNTVDHIANPDSLIAPMSPELLFEYHERMMQRHAAEVERLRGIARSA